MCATSVNLNSNTTKILITPISRTNSQPTDHLSNTNGECVSRIKRIKSITSKIPTENENTENAANVNNTKKGCSSFFSKLLSKLIITIGHSAKRQKNAMSNLERSIDYFNNNKSFLTQEGIFRKSNRLSEEKKVTQALSINDDNKRMEAFEGIHNPHIFCSVIKKNLRMALSLTDKITMNKLAEEFNKNKSDIKTLPIMSELPVPIQKILPLLSNVVDHQKSNKMTALNLATTITPNIMPKLVVTKKNNRELISEKVGKQNIFMEAIMTKYMAENTDIINKISPDKSSATEKSNQNNKSTTNENHLDKPIPIENNWSLLKDIDKELSNNDSNHKSLT
ncbi:Rho GTPase-activating protein [Yersinia massiliensis]|uniref:Rho GTPase-activating protein n=1 Tax=Yersinia massiliensis TaxID=419257 RepID=UPI00030B1B44|nr:Rho GTPase-activating protein [Yersinia massiliensis]